MNDTNYNYLIYKMNKALKADPSNRKARHALHDFYRKREEQEARRKAAMRRRGDEGW
jgi:hypothetical protein